MGIIQAVARDLAAAQAKLATAGDELHQIRSQAAHDSQQLAQARQHVAQLQTQLTTQAEHDTKQLQQAQSNLETAKAELRQIQTELLAIQKAAKQAEVNSMAYAQQNIQRKVCDWGTACLE